MSPEMNIRKIVFAGILFFMAFPSYSQEVCSETLNLAAERLNIGKFYEIPDLLEDCLKNGGFTKEEQIRAYRLLTLSHLYLNYQEKAGEYYLKLLKLSPEYQPILDVDPKELVNFSHLYTTKPLVHIKAHAGVTFTRPQVLMTNSMTSIFSSEKEYTSKVGFNFGAGAEFLISGNLYLVAELDAVNRSMKVTESHFDNSFYQSTIDISQWDFAVPVMLRYNLWLGKLNPFLNAGIAPRFIISASARNQHGNFKDFNGEVQPIRESPAINITSARNKFNYSLVGGIGLNYKIGITFVFLEFRYAMDMLNTVDVMKTTSLDEKGSREIKFYSPVFAEDDYRLSNFSVLLGYNFPFYKPRKIKK